MPSVTSLITAQLNGMNAAFHPGLIPETNYARGINVVVRGGYVKTRPGLHSFSSDTMAMLVPGADLFQGAGVWRTAGGVFVATVFSGVVRLTSTVSGVTTEIGPYLAPTGVMHVVQVGQYLAFHGGGVSVLVLDWVAGAAVVKKTPLVPESMVDDSWDARMQGITLADRIAEIIAAGGDNPPTYAEASATAFAELEVPSYPAGTVACFAHGRLHISSEALGHRYFLSSDLLLAGDPASVLKWWENEYLNGGGGLGLPDELGEIRGMAVMQNSTDTASGIGPLIVLAQEGAAAFSVNLPREGTFDLATSATSGTVSSSAKLLTPGWKDRQIAQVLFYGGGTESPWSLARINGDLIYRSVDGLRTVKGTATASAATVASNAPMSSEVTPFMEFDVGADQLDRVSAATADNRALITVARDGVGYKGIVSLDMSVLNMVDRTVSDTSDSKYIAYDGMWTGVTVAKLLSVGGELIVIETNGRMYKLSRSQWDMVDGVRRDIQCQWISRQDDFKKVGLKKRLEFVELWLRDLLGDVTVSVYYRPDNFAWWTKMGETWSVHCPADLPPQERRRVRFKPNHTTLTGYDGSPLTTGESFQYLIIWTGQLTLHRLYASAAAESESPPLSSTLECDYANIEISDEQLAQNDFSYPG